MAVIRLYCIGTLLFSWFLVEKAAAGGEEKVFDRPWLIVTGVDEPVSVTDNVASLQRELTVLIKTPVEVVTCASLTDEQKSACNLILVGQFGRHQLARTILETLRKGDALAADSDFVKQQGFVVAVCPSERLINKTILAVGWDELGAIYAVSHLRTRVLAQDSHLYLDVEKSPTSVTPYQEVFRPSFEERGAYYNIAWPHLGSLSPAAWDDGEWEFWIDKLVCAQLTHVYFFLWSDSIYFPASPVASSDHNRVLRDRLMRMIRYAHRRGLKVGYHFAPTQIPRDIFDANKDVLKATIAYADDGFPVICSAVPDKIAFGERRWNGAIDLMVDLYREQIQYYREADTFQLWFYDPAGCFCGPDKHNCLNHQASRLMEQVDIFSTLSRRANPQSRFIVSIWPMWVLEPMYKVQFHNEFLDLLSRYSAGNQHLVDYVTVSDSLTGQTYLPDARKRGLRLNGFIFPTNVESGCCLLTPMLGFLKDAVDNGKLHGVHAIHHMRIEEPSKFANTFFASRYYWNIDLTPSEVLQQYVQWIANSNPESAEKLYKAFMLLDSFMCDGTETKDHFAKGIEIRKLVESAFQSLPDEKSIEYESLIANARAVALIGEAVEYPERIKSLSPQFSMLMNQSTTFSRAATSLDQYVKWVSKGWNKENF